MAIISLIFYKVGVDLRFLLLFFLLAITLFAKDEADLEKISVQLKWKHQFQFAGFYMAKEKGFYKDIGLDVELLEYQYGDDIVENVLSGDVDYGVGYPSIILDKTRHKDIILLHALLQSSPHVLVSLKSSGINSVEKFKNKKIMIAGAATYTASFISMLRSHGVDISDLQRVEPSFDVNSLINKEADLITAYTTNELYQLEKKGVAYTVWDPKNYGFDFYDDILFTSQKELQEHPLRVENFTKATLKGFKYAYAHKDETVALIQKKYNTQKHSEGALLYEAKNLEELAYAYKKPLGDIDSSKIQRIIDIYNLFGRIKSKVNLDEFIYKPVSRFSLTDQEKRYLLKKKTITMCVDPEWMPFEKIENGKHVGMSADYIELLKKKLPVEFKLIPTKVWQDSLVYAKERRCDILSLVMPTPQREKFLKFTDPYIKMPIVMATKIDAPFVADFKALKDKKVGITKGYAFLELLQNDYPNLNIVEVDNLKDGLQKVVDGKIDGYIGTLATIGYSFQKNFTGELKIAGKFDDSWDLGIGVRNDDAMLYEILQKSVQGVGEKEKQQIINDWLAISYENSTDYKLLIQVVGLFVLVLFFLLFVYFRERRLKKDIDINRALLEAIINNIPNPVFFKDRDDVFRNVNDAFAKGIIGLEKEELVGKSLQSLSDKVSQEVIDFHYKQDRQLYKKNLTLEYDAVVQTNDGSMRDFKITKTIFRSDEGNVLGYIGIMTDITKHKEKEKKLQQLASVDPLTKLYNRRYFSKMANHLLHLAKRHEDDISLLMMDIDNFKAVNDTYGHDIGDKVIVVLANILQTMSRESDIVARFGGEEFIVLLPKTDKIGAHVIAEKLRKKVEELVLDVHETELHFTVSIGVSEINAKTEENIDKAIKRADEALYTAKRSGKNRVSIA